LEKNTIIQKSDENDFITYIKVEVSPPFLGWIFQFGNKVKIISLDRVKDGVIDYCKKVMENY